MSKLFTLKEWLTVPEAARHLSRLFNEDVVESDVLRLTLDERLKLSVHFVNGVFANPGRFVGIDDVAWSEFKITMGDDVNNLKLPHGVDVGDGRYVALADRIIILEGVWDLPLIGGERLDVERRYQKMTNGPDVAYRDVALSIIDSIFVEMEGGVACRLCERIEPREFKMGSLAHVKTRYYEIMNSISTVADGRLLENIETQGNSVVRKVPSPASGEHYFFSRRIPDDGVLVVRTKNLASFVSSLEEQNDAGQPEDAAKRGTPITDGYGTKLLELLLDGAKQWWSSYDPADSSTAPKSADVTSWFVEKGAPQRVAEVMAQILRADGLPTGPRGSK